VGTVYRHFPDREALQEAVLADHLETLRNRADSLAQAWPAGDALLEWLDEFITHFTQYRGLARTFMPVMQDTATPLGRSCAGMRTAGATLLERAQQAGAVRPDLTMTTLLMLATGIATAVEHAPDDAGPLLPWLIHGLRPRAGADPASPPR
jgi:AcrR family transcriptional regulator